MRRVKSVPLSEAGKIKGHEIPDKGELVHIKPIPPDRTLIIAQNGEIIIPVKHADKVKKLLKENDIDLPNMKKGGVVKKRKKAKGTRKAKGTVNSQQMSNRINIKIEQPKSRSTGKTRVRKAALPLPSGGNPWTGVVSQTLIPPVNNILVKPAYDNTLLKAIQDKNKPKEIEAPPKYEEIEPPSRTEMERELDRIDSRDELEQVNRDWLRRNVSGVVEKAPEEPPSYIESIDTSPRRTKSAPETRSITPIESPPPSRPSERLTPVPEDRIAPPPDEKLPKREYIQVMYDYLRARRATELPVYSRNIFPYKSGEIKPEWRKLSQIERDGINLPQLYAKYKREEKK
jgi:hypothetical protein